MLTVAKNIPYVCALSHAHGGAEMLLDEGAGERGGGGGQTRRRRWHQKVMEEAEEWRLLLRRQAEGE
jgi:hypothetical protein